ncbi:MAG TPA: helix-turn-helix domain-containing protein [Candidatus Limnocylindrales bacterium]|nr:helix-turn-helix domain-containing protein [Candidatus Limnocylindrales bacterium]
MPNDLLTASLTTHRALASSTRAGLLAVLRAAHRPLSVTELAAAMGLHANSVREQLEPLMAARLVDRSLARPTGRGRPGYRYTVRHAALAGPPVAASGQTLAPVEADENRGANAPDRRPAYQALAAALADQLAAGADRRAAAEAAGERWGQALVAGAPPTPTGPAAVGRLVAILDGAGFAPDLSAGPSGTLGLRRCPFAAIVGQRRTVVCGVHLGLMRGALQGLEAPLEATRLEPFVRPDLCLAHLAPTAADGVPAS